MAMSINPQARDITFTFKDSCNSWCCRRCTHQDDRFYVNSQGKLERYSVRKANGNSQEAFTRAMSHLNDTMARKVISFDGSPDLFARKVDRVFQSINALSEINSSHIEAINGLMIEYFSERVEGVNHVRFQDQIIHPLELIEERKEPEGSRCVIL